MSYALHGADELRAALGRQFPNRGSVLVSNDVYCAVTREWVAGPFASYFFEILAARDDLKYRRRGNQCEHFALRAALEAVALFAHADDAEIPAEAESIAVGVCKYCRADGAGWHAVALFYIGGSWLAWEPQTRAFFEFRDAERATVQSVIVL